VEEVVERLEISVGSANPAAEGMVWVDGWVPDAGTMLKDLGVVSGDDTVPFPGTVMSALTALWKRQQATEAALDRLFPGWRMGPAACLPDCRGACCDT
jgi:hypothetical protein